MAGTYTVTQRTAAGEPRRIRCDAHDGCTWESTSTGARRDDDPVFVAQFNHHMAESSVTEKRDLGRLRRGR